MRAEPVHRGSRGQRLGFEFFFLLAVLSIYARRTRSQTLDCSTISRIPLANLSSLQPCIASSAGGSMVLDGSRRFMSPAGGPRQVLDLLFQQAVLFIPPGAVVEITSADLRGIRLQPSPSQPLRLLVGISVQSNATLRLDQVVLETDCYTLHQYQQWYNSSRQDGVSLSDTGDVILSSLRLSGGNITLTGCNITCARPASTVSLLPAENLDGPYNTTVLVSSDIGLYNALALAGYYYGPGTLTLLVSADIVLTSPLWTVQPITVLRNLTIAGSITGSGATRKLVIDLQDITRSVYLLDGVVLSIQDLAFANAGMVFGSAPVPYTGLGFVPFFLWFFEFPRIVTVNRTATRMRLTNCYIISYPEDLVHVSLWAAFIKTPFGPYASLAPWFQIGVYDLQFNSTVAAPNVLFMTLDAYSLLYTNTWIVGVDSSAYSNVTMMARRSMHPLFLLSIPIMTTSVPIWSQADLQNALADAQRLSTCSPFGSMSNSTTYLHLFNNISLDFTKWPGFNVSCNMTISGSIPLNRQGGTWLNFNLLPRFVTLTNDATLTFRAITLFNMPSQQKTYNLGDLTQMTLPLWPISRPPGSSKYLTLESCTIVLPVEEFRSMAATLAVSSDGYLSQALNASVKGFKLDSSAEKVLTVSSFDGLNMTATDTQITDTSNVPFSSPLGPNIYGTASLRNTPPDSATSKGGGSDKGNGNSGGLTSSAVLAIAIAVPLGCIVLGLAGLALFLHRRRNVVRGSADGKDQLDAVGTPGAVSGAGGRSVDGSGVERGRSGQDQAKGTSAAGTAAGSATPGFSDGNTPETEHSGMTEQQLDQADQDKTGQNSGFDSEVTPEAPPLHVELHQLILDFAREIEDKHLTIHDALGSGGFATVYRGTWRGIDVAVKIIEFQDRAAGNERLQARALTEAAIATNIQHANIVTTYSYDIRPVEPNDPGVDTPSSSMLLGIGPSPEGGAAAVPPGGTLVRRRSGSSDQSGSTQAPRMWKLYLIQEFCEVGSLRMALENRMLQIAEGSPNLAMILRLALDVVRGLQHLHKKNIVHGDLTPGNILLKANISRPGHYTAKLADFGLSVKMNPAQTSVDNNRTGTPFYASPEVRQHGNLTKAADIYALGVVLWEMWHCRPCYQRVRGVKHYIHAAGYPNFTPQCPPVYADLAGRCMRRQLEERPQLGEVHDTLRSLLGAAVGGMSSCSTVGSDMCTSGAPSYEWPFVMQACGAPAGQEGGAGGVLAQAGAEDCGEGATGGGSTASSGTPSLLAPGASAAARGGVLAYGGAAGAAVLAYGGAAGAAVLARSGLEPPARAASDIDAAVGEGARPAGAAGGAAGDGSWPRGGGQGRSRMPQEAAGRYSVPPPAFMHYQQQPQLCGQQLVDQAPRQTAPQKPSSPDRVLRCVQQQQQVQHYDNLQRADAAAAQPATSPGRLLAPGMAGAAELPAVGPAAGLVGAAKLSPSPRLAAALVTPGGKQPDSEPNEHGAYPAPGQGQAAAIRGSPAGGGGVGDAAVQGASISISLQLPTGDDFVTALGSRTED